MHYGWSWCHAKSIGGGYSGHYMAVDIVIGSGDGHMTQSESLKYSDSFVGMSEKETSSFLQDWIWEHMTLEYQKPPWRARNEATMLKVEEDEKKFSCHGLKNSWAFQLYGSINSLLKPVWVWRFSKESWYKMECVPHSPGGGSIDSFVSSEKRSNLTGDTSKSWHPLSYMYQERASLHWKQLSICFSFSLFSCCLGW